MRCGRFICAACDPHRGKRCQGCLALAREAAAPWKARQRRSAVVLALGGAIAGITYLFERPLHGNVWYQVLLSLGMCFGLVAVLWSTIAWSASREAPEPEGRSGLSFPIAGAGCLLAVLAVLAMCFTGG